MSMLDGPKGSFILVDYIVSALAILGNLIALDSVLHVHFGLTGYRRFLISLIFSDLYISLVHIATFCLPLASGLFDKCSADLVRILQIVGFIANLLNLCGMSIDHYLGILHPLRYRDYMSKRITCSIIFLIWVIAFILGFADIVFAAIVNFFGALWPEVVSNVPSLAEQFRENTNNNSAPSTSPIEAANRGGVLSAGEPHVNVSQSLLNSLMTILSNRDSQQALAAVTTLSSTAMLNDPHDEGSTSKSLTNFMAPYAKIFGANSYRFGTKKEQHPAVTVPPFLSGEDSDMSSSLYDYTDQTTPIIQHPDIFDKLSPDIETFLQAIIMNSNESVFNSGTDPIMIDSDNGILSILGGEANPPSTWCAARNETVWLEFCVMTLTILCFAFLIACYGRIFKEVFSNYNQPERSMRRLVLTTMLLLGSFMLCWIPFMAFEFTMIIVLHTNFNVNDKNTLSSSASFFALHNAFNTLLMCSPLFDPIIYAARMRVIRQAILFRYGRLFPCLRSYLELTRERSRKRRCSFVPYAINGANGTSRLSPCDDQVSIPGGNLNGAFANFDQLTTASSRVGSLIPLSDYGANHQNKLTANTPYQQNQQRTGTGHCQRISSYVRRRCDTNESSYSNTTNLPFCADKRISSARSLFSFNSANNNYGSTTPSNEGSTNPGDSPEINRKNYILRSMWIWLHSRLLRRNKSSERSGQDLISSVNHVSGSLCKALIATPKTTRRDSVPECETIVSHEDEIDCNGRGNSCLIVVKPPSSTHNDPEILSSSVSFEELMDQLDYYDTSSVFGEGDAALPGHFETTQSVLNKFYANSTRLLGHRENDIDKLLSMMTADLVELESGGEDTFLTNGDNYNNYSNSSLSSPPSTTPFVTTNTAAIIERMATILWNSNSKLRLTKSHAISQNKVAKHVDDDSASLKGYHYHQTEGSKQYRTGEHHQIVFWQD